MSDPMIGNWETSNSSHNNLTDQKIDNKGLSNSAQNKITMTYTEFLDKSPMSKFLWVLLSGVLLAQFLDGMNLQATSFALPGIIAEFKISHARAGLVASIASIGLLLGALLFSAYGDRVGRKPIFQWVLITYAFGTCLSALAVNFQMLLVAQFIAGLGLGAQFPIAWAILAEYAPVRLRHIFLPLAPLCYVTGWITVALLSLWLVPRFGWRSIYWVGVAPALMAIYLRYYLPESIRFLLSRGRTEEAGQIANDLARKAGVTNLNLVPPVLAKEHIRLDLRQRLALLKMIWAPITVFILFFFASSLQTYGLNAWLPTIFVLHGYSLKKSFKFTIIILAMTPISQVIAMWLQNKIKRTTALLVMTVGGTVFFVLFGLSFQFKWPIILIVGTQVVQTLFSQGIVPIISTISSEVVPTPARTLGLGIITTVGRLGSILGPLILGIFLSLGAGVSVVIYLFAAPLVLAAILMMFVIKVDTRGKSLEEIALTQGT